MQKTTTSSTRPYFDILSVREYARKALKFEDSDSHRIKLSIKSGTTSTKSNGDTRTLTLYINGVVAENGSFVPKEATAKTRETPTDEDYETYLSPVEIEDAVLRWGSHFNEMNILEWDAEPVLRSWTIKEKASSETLTLCPKCGGQGWIPQYRHIENGICFKCGGAKYLELRPRFELRRIIHPDDE